MKETKKEKKEWEKLNDAVADKMMQSDEPIPDLDDKK